MGLGKIKIGIVKNGVLLSLMMFYFSCGKDVFPPDFPGEDLFARKSPFSLAGSFLETEAWGKVSPSQRCGPRPKTITAIKEYFAQLKEELGEGHDAWVPIPDPIPPDSQMFMPPSTIKTLPVEKLL